MTFFKQLTLEKVLPYILMLAAAIGIMASFVLTYDKIQVLADASYEPACNINPILSCGSVMKTEQASLMGVPNTIFGLIAFSMLFTFGFLVASGSRVKRPVWLVAQLVATIGVICMHYLFFQGLYRIGAICPWCAVVWFVTIPTFWYITVFNLRNRYLRLPGRLQPFSSFIQKHHADILLAWFLILLGLIAKRFWYFWATLI